MVRTGSGTDWIALSDKAGIASGPEVGRGLFAAEFRLPLDGAQVLLDRRSADGAEVFSILHDTAAGLSVLHRRGGQLARHALPGPLPLGRATGRMLFDWDAAQDRWRLQFGLLGADAPATALQSQGRGVLGLAAPLLADLCAGRGQRHEALLWFGVTKGALPRPKAWLGARSMVPTAQGPMPAEELRAGDPVLTANGAVPLLSVERHVVPGRGSFQPVLLRAPWFGRSDLLVSAEQLVRVAGPEAEYLFGEEEVLVPAGLLVDGQSALAEGRRAVVSGVALEFGGAELVEVQGCTICTDPAAGLSLPLRLLDRYEAVPLMAQLGRLPQRAVG
ncbi:Hint domain-containing protein [Paragemmobacter straminiformis]|uniref:Hint domain-containing protein n=1 Tax=Paragemmobacter straminiformis TaxID=2045119 RepID=A0A842IEM9_9RHOB|nr:Hint domain-containing protein [Gemmobacter straminiformis]MBC2837547.1 Hint domain-containing protein [Gemmobacter straminiformis]